MANVENSKYFRAPESDILGVGSLGTAVANIRSALRLLGYNATQGNSYDAEVTTAVREFQIDSGHSSTDGKVGPGTRNLLALRIEREFGLMPFDHLRDPSTDRVKYGIEFERLSSLFRDQHNDSKPLAPGYVGPAVKNVGEALAMLGCRVVASDVYDNALQSAVLKFQNDIAHASRDGCVGPGTRRALTLRLIKEFGPDVVERFTDQPQYLQEHIFVSYKRDDLDRIQPYINSIVGWGYRTWYDQEIPGSADYFALIEEKINGCTLQIAFLTQSAVESKWVRKEVYLADSLNKLILPIFLEDVRLHSGMNIILAGCQHLQDSDPAIADKLKNAIEFALR